MTAMLLKRIEIHNIHSITHVVVDLDENGITAVIGHPGAGKTTIIETPSWVLFGELPGGLVQATMRSSHAAPGEAVAGEVTMTVGENVYRARRELRRSGRRDTSEVASARLWIDDVEQEQITASKLTAAMTELLGMSGKAFRSAYVIPQAQLTRLVQSTASEVQSMIETLTGIDALAQPIKAARKRATESKAAAGALPGSEVEVAEAEHVAGEAGALAERAEGESAAANAAAQAANEQWRTADRAARDFVDAAAAAAASEREVAAAQAREAAAREAWEELAGEVRAAGLDAAALEVGEVRRRVEAVRARGTTVDGMSRQLGAVHLRWQAQIEDVAAAEAAQAATPVAGAREDAARLAATRQEAAAALARQERALAEIRVEGSALKKSLDELRSLEHASLCPTCRSPLTDPAALAAVVLREYESMRTRYAAESARAEELRAAAAAAEDRAVRSAGVAADAQRVAEQITLARRRATGLQAEVDEAVAAARAAGAFGVDVLEVIESLASMSTQLRGEYDRLRDLEGLVGRAVKARQLVSTTAAAAGAARAAVTTAPDPAVVAAARSAAGEARTVLDAANNVAARALAAVSAAQADAVQTNGRLYEARERLADKQTAIDTAERDKLAADVLVAYRADLLSEYTGAISQSATAILTRLNPEWVSFTISGDDFTPRVTLIDGTVRPTRQLSGGEKAIAALSFFLGISREVSGGVPGTLTADEITFALDEEGRRAMTNALRELGQPLILVSHSPESTDFANRVVQVSRGVCEPTSVLVAA